MVVPGRTPQGVRGLKSGLTGCRAAWSHPARGAWIEIGIQRIDGRTRKSHPARGAWIEIRDNAINAGGATSHPARGAWIEIARGTHEVL